MRPTKFKIESLGYETYDGFTKGEFWNGWDCPYFTFEQAQKILKTFNQLRQIIGLRNLAYYDSSNDAFVFPADDEWEIFNADFENGQKFYPVGAYSWIWEHQN